MKIAVRHQLVTGNALLVTLCALLFSAANIFAQGSLAPPGAPAATMKTLDQIEARTPISSAPFTISSSGSYYLTKNLTVTTGDAITINANQVTLDLNGFTISSTAASAVGTGVLLGSATDITILNGHIKGGVTYSGGTYSGPGFSNGIYHSGGLPSNVRVSGVSVSGCLVYGINLFTGISTVVESCTVQTVGGDGIYASAVSHSTANQCGLFGIRADTASDCVGYSTSSSSPAVSAPTANNCYGYGAGGGTAISANTANNCFGYSTGTGVDANTANNCYGYGAGGIGLSAFIATGCYGISSTNTGLYAPASATNCYGKSTNLDGINAGIAIGCYGDSTNGVGLRASVANSSYGTSEVITNKYNMP